MKLAFHPFVTMAAITFVAVFLVASLGMWFGHFAELDLSLKESGHSLGEFNWPATSLLETGTFNYGRPGFEANMLRGPGYAMALAATFSVFGVKLGTVYGLNMFFLLCSLWLIWRMSARFLKNGWEFLPPLMAALFFGFASHVWNRNYELYVLFFALLSWLSFLRYREMPSPWWLACGAISYAIWTLEKPIILYAFPLVIIIVILAPHARVLSKKILLAHIFIFFGLFVSVIGPWMIRNRMVLETWQMGTGGPIILRPSTQVDYPASHLMNIALSFSLGDVIGSKLSSSYPSDGTPAYWDPAIESRYYQRGWYITEPNGEVITRIELDKRMYKEAFANIMRKPFKFLLTSPLGILRLNAPVNLGGQEIMHLFWGRNLLGSETLTIAIILAIRIAWFVFLGIVLWMWIHHLQLWRTQWSFILFFVLYFNIMYGTLTHAEARYIFTMMPFYFILFADGVRHILKKFP